MMNPLPTSNECLNVELDWEFDARTSEIENDLDYLADLAALSMMEPVNRNGMEIINGNAMEISPNPNNVAKETVAPRSHCQGPSDFRSVETVSDTSPSLTSENSHENLDQALQKQKRARPVKRATKPAVTTSRLRWKKPKDAPKRYLSAYNYFFQEERKRIYAEESDERASFSGLGKIIGQRWKALTEEERKPYDIMAERDMYRYREEMMLYEDFRRRKFGRSLYRSPSSVTAASTLSNDTQFPSTFRVSPALHPVLESNRSQHHSTHHPPQPTLYAPQMVMPNQYHNDGGQYVGQLEQQQYAQQQQQPQVQYACVRMTRKKAKEYMRRVGGRH
jgi:hypothetical protein